MSSKRSHCIAVLYKILSRVFLHVGGPATVGGNIRFDPKFVILQDSQLIANNFEGQGGRIQITTDVFLADPASRVDASSGLGLDASVTNVPVTIAPLPQSFGQQTELLRGRCAQRLRGGERSSFVLAKRDGLPLEPGTLLPSPLVAGSPVGAQSRSGPEPASVIPARFWQVDDNGYAHIRGARAQGPLPRALDWKCGPWEGR
jgi:hypothetical protein